MKTIVKITVKTKEDGNIIRQYLTNLDLPENQTSEQIKPLFANEYEIPTDCEIDFSSLFLRKTELQNTDTVSLKSGLEYVLVLKKKGSEPNFLGRQYKKDDRDFKFLISEHLLKGRSFDAKLTSKYWDDNIWWGDQGNTPQCVGYAWCHWVEDGPVTHSGIHPLVAPNVIYSNAQKLDEWPGENYAGTSVRGGVKYLQSQKLVGNYYWAFDINTLINTVLNLGPVVVGTNWYYNMFFPNNNGLIRLGGYLAGGHAYVINGVDTNTKLFRIKNSWGKSWGVGGHAFISFTDMTRLIKEQGEICIATELPK